VNREGPLASRWGPERWALLGMWLAVSAAMVWLCRENISNRFFPDPDDAMRLMQVRAWLDGQSWFDVTQYRLNAPAGVPMHWSRLIDVPIASVILSVRPFVGQDSAEAVALTIVPLITLAVAMLLVHRIACRLMSPRAALLAVIPMGVSLGALQQMRPMRIDHHGWQIALSLLAVLGALDERHRRSGLIAGTAMALWLNISIEGLPFTAAVGALFEFMWLMDRSAVERLKAYVGALACTSLLAFGLTHYPSTWLSQPHDVITVAHLAGFTVAALGCAVFVRSDIGDAGRRLAVLGFIGAVALLAMFATDRHWMEGPFESLDPLVKAMWYYRIDEGLPIWDLEWSQIGIALAQPMVGLAGALVAIRRTSGALRNRWLAYTYLLCASALASVFVVRAATTASLISLPGTGYLCLLALVRARNLSLMPVRVLATFGALCIIAPAYAVPVSLTTIEPRVQHAVNSFQQCLGRAETSKLAALPTGTIAAPLDITPDLLVNTSHRAVASGHHRGGEAMADVIRLFVYPPDQGRQIIDKRHVDYVIICPGAPESVRYAYHGKGGLSEMLAAGKAPAWLEPVRVPGLRALRVWRVRHG
jgi:hypothetical protein